MAGIIQTALTPDPLATTTTPATAPVATPLTTPTKLPDPTQWTTTPDQTVAGNVQKLTAEDSGIIQQARTRSNQKMNERGLLNSSMAQSASDSAAYDAAIPIAQADAANASKVAGYNTDTKNKFAAQDTDVQNQFALKNLDAKTQTALAEISVRDKLLLQRSNIAADAYKQYSDILYQNSINKNMDGPARAQADENAFRLYQDQISLASILTGLPDVSAQLNFTGIAPAAGTPASGWVAPVPASPVGVPAVNEYQYPSLDTTGIS